MSNVARATQHPPYPFFSCANFAIEKNIYIRSSSQYLYTAASACARFGVRTEPFSRFGPLRALHPVDFAPSLVFFFHIFFTLPLLLRKHHSFVLPQQSTGKKTSISTDSSSRSAKPRISGANTRASRPPPIDEGAAPSTPVKHTSSHGRVSVRIFFHCSSSSSPHHSLLSTGHLLWDATS